jgi:hypothetical protein
MDTLKIINELRQERENIDQAIAVLARMNTGKRRRGRPPAFLKNLQAPKRRGRPPKAK